MYHIHIYVCLYVVYIQYLLLKIYFKQIWDHVNQDLMIAFWRRKWQPTPVFLPGESHGRRSLVGYSPQGGKESDTTERLHFSPKM